MKRQGGFSLLEVLVALAIFALIGLASNGLLTRVIDSNSLSTEQFAQLQTLQHAMIVIERDVLQAVPRPARIGDQHTSQVMIGGPGQFDSQYYGLSFVRGGRMNPQWMLPRSDLQPVMYRVQDDELQRVSSNYVDNVLGSQPTSQVLLTGIEDFSIEFIVKKGKNAKSYAGTVLPLALKMTIKSKEYGDITRFFTLRQNN